jgi:hypothetical protein
VSDRPAPVDEAARLLAGFDRTWLLCGGWGVDAWLGRQSRDHLDVDIAMLEHDQSAIHGFFGEGWLLNGHDPFDDDSTTPWDGHRLVVPAHIHARGADLDGLGPAGAEHNLDIQLERVDGGKWVFRDDPRLGLPLARAILTPPWGVPTLAPEAIVFYKSGPERRPHDEADCQLLLPILSRAQRDWLRGAIAATDAAHPWLSVIEG